LTDQPELINSAGHGTGHECGCDLTLKDAGLVTDRRGGRWVYDAISPDGLEALRRALDELRPLSRGLRVLRRGD